MQSKKFKKYFSSFNNKNFFNRTKEINNILSILKDEPALNIVSGGNDTGKSMLLSNVFYENFPKQKLNIIHIDFRKFPCNSVHDFAKAISISTPKTYFDKLVESIPRSIKIEIPNLFNLEFSSLSKHEFTFSDLGGMLSSIENAAPLYDESNKYTNIIFFDEVNRLNNLCTTETGKLAFEYFFEWITIFTKQIPKFHVFFGTSDSFFVHEMQKKMKDRCSFITIGDLLYDEAHLFFETCIKKYSKEEQIKLNKLNFKDEVFEFVGGRIYHIKNAIKSYVINDLKSFDLNIFKMAKTSYYEALRFEKGSTGLISFENKVGWNTETLQNAMKTIAERGFISFDKIKKDEQEELLSLVSCNLLNYRHIPPIKEDIIGLNRNDYPALISPSPIRHKAIKCIVEKNFKI